MSDATERPRGLIEGSGRLGEPVDDMHCATCGSEVMPTDVRSVAVVEWVPFSQSNLLLAVLCTDPRCMRDWNDKRIPETWPQ